MAVELPDEAVTYSYQGALAPAGEEWTAAAELRTRHFIQPARLKEIGQRLNQCRSQIAAEREMRNVPPELLPLDAGFIDLPQIILDQYRRKQDASELGRVLTLANRLREAADWLVVLGTGGPTLGPLALFQALRGAQHNQLAPEHRIGLPRLFFDGCDFDNDSLQDLLEMLQVSCVDPERREERWGVVTINRSGTALEPGVALRLFRREATEYYGLRSPLLAEVFAAVTGTTGRTRDLFKALGHGDDSVLTIPDNVSDRFSVFTPAGLLPAALVGLDVRALLLGAAAMTRRFLDEPFERNPVLQLAVVNYLMAEELGKPIRVLSVWSRRLEALGRWYDHLVSESLGKQGRGPTPLTLVQPRDLHARGQHLHEGPRDRFVLNVVVKTPRAVAIPVQMADRNEDDLNTFNRKTLLDFTNAARTALSRSHFDTARPTAELMLPALSEHTLGQLMQMMMLATVVEGRLMGINPYSQPSNEVTQRQLRAALSERSTPGSGPVPVPK